MTACISKSATKNDYTSHHYQQQQYNQIIKIYIDWGNHYLQKARLKKHITNLHTDLNDGVILADLVEAVCGHKVDNINRKPRTPATMVENIRICLSILDKLGVSLEGIIAKDIKDGNLKSVLALFFALSKYKQQQKQRSTINNMPDTKQIYQKRDTEDVKQSRLPSPYVCKQTPSTRPSRGAFGSGITSLKASSANSSRSASPSHSFIPTPKASRSSLNEKQLIALNSGLTNSSTFATNTTNTKIADKTKSKSKLVNKRTSSSSVISSAHSERSNSSSSIYHESKNISNDGKRSGIIEASVKPMLRKKVIVKPASENNNNTKLNEKTLSNNNNNDYENNNNILSQQIDTTVICKPPLINEGIRLSSSGIPKPMAAVKGTVTKPTNSVAPMVIIDKKSNNNNDHDNNTTTAIHNEKKHSLDKSELMIRNNHNNNNNEISTNHEKQSSGIEEDELLRNIKPMEPLLRGYKKSFMLPHRAMPVQNGYQLTNKEDYDCKIYGDDIYSVTASGYLSDGEVLQCNTRLYSDNMMDGYMSEGAGPQIYHPHYDTRHYRRNVQILPSISDNPSIKSTLPVALSSDGNKRTDVLTALSRTSPLYKPGNRLNGRGQGLDQSPVSPPEPTPTHGASYRNSPPEPSPIVYRVIGSRSHIKKDCGQQTDNTPSRSNNNAQWKKYIEVGMANRVEGNKDKPIAKKTERRRTSSVSGSREELTDKNDKSKQARGIPSSSFGYVKRSSNSPAKDSRTTPVVSRTKVKVSGGTQTDMKSYSLGSAAAAQLSQGIRERLIIAADGIHKSPIRTNNNMESLSDSNDMQQSPYGTWSRHPSPYAVSYPARSSALVGLTEADSIESLPAQLHHRASLTHSRLITSPAGSPCNNRLSRSNSISYLRERTFPRSTKSEKLYPSMLQRSDELEPLYATTYALQRNAEPPSPTPSNPSSSQSSNRYNNYATQQGYRNSPYSGYLANTKEENINASSTSLVSTTSSSIYGTSLPEEKQALEIRKLRKDLHEAQEKVLTLTSQLSTNAHVVSAFEKSLSNMTQRLQQLTATAEKKDAELLELKRTIEMLRKQHAEHACHTATSPSMARRHTINNTETTPKTNDKEMSRQLSADSMSSLVSLSSGCSLSSGQQHLSEASSGIMSDKNKKKRGWLRSSFSKAFSKSKKNRNGSVSDIEDSRIGHSDLSAPSSPLLNTSHNMNGRQCHQEIFEENDDNLPDDGVEVVQQLKKQLREKDLVLTDIRLEALSSAHQLESLKDTVIKMRNEMLNLKQDNDRLQRIVTNKSLASSQSSLQTHDCSDRRYSTTDAPTTSSDEGRDDLLSEKDGKRITVSVYCGSHGSYHRYVTEKKECAIATVTVNSKTNWNSLDTLIYAAFQEYLNEIDENTSLGLSVDSIWSYHVGQIIRYKDSNDPELLPCGYLVGKDDSCINICLKGALHNGSFDAIAFDTLIPKAIVQRYVSLLTEHKRIVLCGPDGTGKSYLARKLSEFLVFRAGKNVNVNESIVAINVDEKNHKELKQYLHQICDVSSTLPIVIILDNIRNASSFSDLFVDNNHRFDTYVIATINQPISSTANISPQFTNFRCVLYGNNMEPVKGLLSRYLRRRLIHTLNNHNHNNNNNRNNELYRITQWIAKVQHHLNHILEIHSSNDVSISGKLFMSCPMEVDGSQVWFTDLWNYSLVPYLMNAIKEGLQLYGKRSSWQDPTAFIIQTYPWGKDGPIQDGTDALIKLRAEDVGYETNSQSDPLLNMLMTLQEAANYSSSVHSNDSDHAHQSEQPNI